MAVKAIALPLSIGMNGAGNFQVELQVITNDGTTQFTYTVTGLPMSILESTLNSALRAAIRDELINHYGFTFGLLDSVTIFGVSLSI